MDNLVGQQFGDTRDAALGEPMARCVACQEDIRPGAAICTKCKTPQNWTRYIFNWKDVGSAILALVPLWTGAIALWALAFREPAAELRAAAPICEKARVLLAFVNDGDATAVLKLPLGRILQGAQTSSLNVELLPDPPDQYPYLLAPKQSSPVTLRPKVAGLSTPLPTKSSDTSDTCILIVETVFRGFKGREATAAAQCPCPAES
jgi:hypothetical protein